jgi:sugar lactone lactonase YvrE
LVDERPSFFEIRRDRNVIAAGDVPHISYALPCRSDAMTISPTRVLGLTPVAIVLLAPLAAADQGSFANSGGSTSVNVGVHLTGSVAAPPGTIALDCPAVGAGSCAGGSLTYLSNDTTTAIHASFSSGTFSESCSGGGRGGHITCTYDFVGYISGTLTANGTTQAINGVTYQRFGTGGAAAVGATGYNSAYTPFYYSDTEQILRSDDLQGTNQITYGSQGSGAGEFYGAYGLALDAAGRLYVADTYNCRIVRIDDMTGRNWITYGGVCGSGQGEFADPEGVAVDPAGRIYVMDTGNSRIVRVDDMSGANWAAFGSIGSGTGQLSANLTSLALDSAGRIYVADTGNRRIVRTDDISGTNWTALSQSPPVNGVSATFQSPSAVSIDSSGRIYVADNESYQPAVIRVDDMTGANWTAIYTASTSGLNSIAVDSSGMVLAGGGGVQVVDNMTAVLHSSGAIGPIGSYYVFGVTPIPLPSPRPSAIGISPAALAFTQNAGTSGSQPITISNFGGSPLSVDGMSATGGFSVTPDCPASLPAGATCTASVTYAPAAAGQGSGVLTIRDDSGNLGSTQTVALTGTTGCQDALTLSDTSGALNIGFTLSTPAAATWATWLVINNAPIQLWSAALPPLSPPVVFNVPIRGFPPLGNVTVFTALISGGQLACYDSKIVNTGD